MKVEAHIHSLKDHKNDRHVLGEAEIIRQVGDNQYLAEVNGVRCMAIFNPFASRYFVDDVYGIIPEEVTHLQSAASENIGQQLAKPSTNRV